MSGVITAIVGVGVLGAATGIWESDQSRSAANRAADAQANAAAQAGQQGSDAYIKAAQIQADAQIQAAQMQSEAAAAAEQQQIEWMNKQFGIAKETLSPWISSGQGALNRLSSGLAQGGEFSQPFTKEQFLANQDPAYEWDKQQGINALTAAGSAAGNLGSGTMGTALVNYGQQQASNEYQNAWGRWNTSQKELINSLMGLSAQGEGAAGQLAGDAVGVGEAISYDIGNALNNSAQAQAQGLIGSSQAQAGGLIGSSQAQANALQAIAQAQAAGLIGSQQATMSGYTNAFNQLMGGVGTGMNVLQRQQLLDKFNFLNQGGGGGNNWNSLYNWGWGGNNQGYLNNWGYSPGENIGTSYDPIMIT